MAVPILARSFSNTATPTSLVVSMGSNDATATLQNVSNWPNAPFTICAERNTINQEFMLVTGYVPSGIGQAPSKTPTTTNAVYVTRGYNGTAGISHQSAVTVEHCTGAIDYQEANAHHTDQTRDDHGQYLTTLRHQNVLIHQAGISIPVAIPGSLTIGGLPNTGSSTALSAADHVHGMPNYETIGSAVIPIGGIMIAPWHTYVALDYGWIYCLGGSYLQSQFPICYQRLGTTWGPTGGSGANATFTLPNLSGGIIAGTGSFLINGTEYGIGGGATGVGTRSLDARAVEYGSISGEELPAQLPFIALNFMIRVE